MLRAWNPKNQWVLGDQSEGEFPPLEGAIERTLELVGNEPRGPLKSEGSCQTNPKDNPGNGERPETRHHCGKEMFRKLFISDPKRSGIESRSHSLPC